MPGEPLQPDLVTILQRSETAALAATMIIAVSFPSVLAFAARVVSPTPGTGPRTGPRGPSSDEALKEAGAGEQASVKANGNGAKKRAHSPGRKDPRGTAAKRDEALLALLRANPEARTAAIVRLAGRAHNTTVTSLKRLEQAGLVEHAGRGKWTVVDADLLENAPPKPAGWIAPLSGQRVARHAADGRVRDELTLA